MVLFVYFCHIKRRILSHDEAKSSVADLFISLAFLLVHAKCKFMVQFYVFAAARLDEEGN